MTIAISAEGLHPTTESCLEALQWLQEKIHCRTVLDMGCGNGILSLTAASIWGASVIAADISPQAIIDTKQMVEESRLQDSITVIRSDGFSNPLIKNNSPYDLICFNLLAEPIITMASQVKAHLSENGVVILSGILRWHVASVETTYKALGFEMLKQIINEPWCTLILSQNGNGRFLTS